MTRRLRIRLLVILVVVGLPLIAVAIIGWYVASGRLERRIERAYAEHYPGTLQIGGVRIASANKVVLSNVRLVAPGDSTAMVTIPQLTVGGSALTMRLSSISAEGAEIVIDRAAVALFKEFAQRPSGGEGNGGTATPFDLTVHATAKISVSGGMHADDLRFDLTASGGRLSGALTGSIDNAPVQLVISTADDALQYQIAVKTFALSTHRLFACLDELDLMDPIPKIMPWIPDLAETHDATLRFDPATMQLGGVLPLSWATGTGNATVALTATGLTIDPAIADDSELGAASGRLTVNFPQKSLLVDVPSWKPGPRLPIPPKLDLGGFMQLLPAAHFELTNNTGKPRFHLTALPDLSGQAYQAGFDLIGEKNGPLHLRANDVPLTLAQPWLPDQITVSGGRILGMLLEADDNQLKSIALTAAEAQITCGEWLLGPLDAGIEVVPQKDAEGWSSTAILPMATVEYHGNADGGLAVADIGSLKKLFAQLHGPRPAPSLSGALHLETTITHGELLRGEIKSLQTTNVKMAEVFRSFDSSSAGTYEYKAEEMAFDIHLSGQVRRGDVWIPNTWLNIANRQPVFTATVGLKPGQIELREVLARAADEQGQPTAEGFTAGIDGTLTTEPLSGTIKGVIDRADLEWVKSNTKLVPLPKSSVIKGRGAATFTAVLSDDGVERIDGYFLPLNDDLSMLKDDRGVLLDISGIKGAVKFRLLKAK